ncbi:MAG: hypothetical protein ACE5IC_05885 [Candidatus Brocadiales bacterium]
MTYEEEEYEAVIIQKLEDMEDFLRSFVSSLEEPDQEKGGRFELVIAPVRGKITEWTPKKEVREGDPLCVINSDPLDPEPDSWDFHKVYSPATGRLLVLVGRGRMVTAGKPIAEIDKVIGIPV